MCIAGCSLRFEWLSIIHWMANVVCGATLKAFKEVGGMSRSLRARLRQNMPEEYWIFFIKCILEFQNWACFRTMKISTLSEYLVVSSRRGKPPEQEEERGWQRWQCQQWLQLRVPDLDKVLRPGTLLMARPREPQPWVGTNYLETQETDIIDAPGCKRPPCRRSSSPAASSPPRTSSPPSSRRSTSTFSLYPHPGWLI